MPELDDDEFFRQCRRRDRIYRLTLGENRPSSIRDQLGKACRLVRLISERVQRVENLLVVGAGVAGVTAAWKAANLGINATLWEGQPEPFSTQAACDTRWLHPNEYRWPTPGFDDPTFRPADTSCFPDLLRWDAGIPSEIVAGWRSRFHEWVEAPLEVGKGSVTWDDEHELTLPSDQTDLDGYFKRLGLGTVFNAILLCIGGTERCSVPGSRHRGFYFWEADDYGRAHFGSTSTPTAGPRTLISGGGDGALQDFLRIACQHQNLDHPVHALWILNQLTPALEECEPFIRLMAALTGFSDPARPQPAELSATLLAFLRELEAASACDQLKAALDRLIDPTLLDGRKTLHLNLGRRAGANSAGPVFRTVYTLNAFLVTLFAWRLQATPGNCVFLPSARLAEVQSNAASHVCASVPGLNGCLLQAHRAVFEAAATDADADPADPWVEEYDVIVIRHGIQNPAHDPSSEPRTATQLNT